MTNKMGEPIWRHLDDVIDELVVEYPHLAQIKDAAPESDYRITGLKLPVSHAVIRGGRCYAHLFLFTNPCNLRT